MAAELIFQRPDVQVPLEDFNLVGRDADATIHVEDASVSRKHASIRRQGSAYWVTDLGSSNHTYLNGLIVRNAQKLADGDQLRFGHIDCQFVSDEPAQRPMGAETALLQTQVLTQAEPLVQSKPVVMLVGDLKAYSELSNRLPAAGLATLMNYWYEDCRGLLTGKEAVVDKFIGDCVFAYWHSDGPRAHQLALEAAVALANTTGRLTEDQRKMLADNKASFDCCVGLHVGEVALGGSSKDDYTALGDAVNLAFRIEALTRDLETGILASAEFVSGCPQVEGAVFQDMGPQQVKGFEAPVGVFALGAG